MILFVYLFSFSGMEKWKIFWRRTKWRFEV